MAEIIMPKMGDAMTEGKVVRWYKKSGDAVKKGEPVLEGVAVTGQGVFETLKEVAKLVLAELKKSG